VADGDLVRTLAQHIVRKVRERVMKSMARSQLI
jgi:hypothetical protein